MCEMSEEIHQRMEERAKRQERPQNTNELKGIKGILLRGITSAIFVFFHLGILYLGSSILVSYTCFLYDFFFTTVGLWYCLGQKYFLKTRFFQFYRKTKYLNEKFSISTKDIYYIYVHGRNLTAKEKNIFKKHDFFSFLEKKYLIETFLVSNKDKY